MSEAILFAIDAPGAQGADDAADFVETWRDNNEAPTARIANFFDQLLSTWPEDGSKGRVWHEDFAQNKPLGPLLEMVFELGGFDAERLQQLCAIAQQHQVSVFDPEGHALYLPDGSEAGVPAMAAPVAGTPAQCAKSGLRFDGVYESKLEKNWSYLCFTADGRVLWQSIGGRFSARAVMDTFIAGDSFVVKGKYKPDSDRFTAGLKAAFGSFRMSGERRDDGLHVHSERTNGRYPYDTVYQFVPL